jgi:ABC-type lipoprotein release transport system permease subunit
MLKSTALILIIVIFGLLMLTLTLVTVASLLVCIAAMIYRLIPGPNVPLGYNFRNLRVRWKNSLVTALAFVVVIGLLTAMMAFVVGMYNLTENSGRPGNVIMLQSGTTDEAMSKLPPGADIRRLPDAVQNAILREGNVPLVAKEVFVVVNQPIPNAPPGGKQRRFVQMRGIDFPAVAGKVHGVVLEEGRWISEEGVQTIKGTGSASWTTEQPLLLAGLGLAGQTAIPDDRAIEVVIGAGIAHELGRDRPGGPIKTGEILEIGPRKWIVVGVMSTASSTFASEVWARDYILQDLFGRPSSYTSYVVATKNAKTALQMAKDLKEFKEVPLNAQPETEYYASLSATNRQFLFAIIVVAVIMAIGGVLGVMNTMFATISQRAKDIGVLRLLGFSRWQILVSFLLESLALAFLGGIIGCALGSLSNGLTATSIVSSGTGGGGGGKSVILKLVVDGRVIGVSMLFTFIMGAVGGLIPALSAMRLKPLESLR